MDLFITFDYELFLGPKTGSVENCLIRPTERYLELAERLGIHYIFFVDVLYLLKLREHMANHEASKKDYHLIIVQLSEAVKRGHDIQLHLHPQWFYSSYDEGGWKLDYKHYKIDDCPIEDVSRMIKSGGDLIKEISGIPPTAYRAGGYSFPSDIRIVKMLHDSGIVIDSSVVMFSKSKSVFQSYDYSKIKSFDTYNFYLHNSLPSWKEESRFVEYPISCCRVSWLNTFKKKKKLRNYHTEDSETYGDGIGVGAMEERAYNGRLNKFPKVFSKKTIRASLDFTNAFNLQLIYKTAKRFNSSIMLIIGHPKNTTNISLEILEKFIKENSLSNHVKTFGK